MFVHFSAPGRGGFAPFSISHGGWGGRHLNLQGGAFILPPNLEISGTVLRVFSSIFDETKVITTFLLQHFRVLKYMVLVFFAL